MEVYIMHILSMLIVHIICMPKLSFGICPDYRKLGPRTEDDKSMCAQVFMDATDVPNTSCGGESRDVYNTEETGDLGSHWTNAISSLVVRDGCTLTVWQHANFHNDHEDFEGLIVNLDHEHIHLSDWDNDISSYKCKCNFNPVACKPTDDWVMVVSCANPGSATITCKYTPSHGFTIGHSVSNGFDFDTDIKLGIGLEFGEIFAHEEASGSLGLHTGYNWTESKEFTQPSTAGTVLTIEVEKGQIGEGYQVMGYCDDSTIHTLAYQVRYRPHP